jgi:glycosyltransferase involved in cell wall biosynthesis
MDVSVVVCTYNRAPSLGLTLRALDVQVTPPDLTWELVVVDNNSADATRSVVDAFTATARIQVRYLFEPQQGLSHARNAGIAHARGGIVAFTDDDVRPEPDWVAGVNAALRETGADIVGGRILPAWDHPPPAWLEARPFLRGPLAIMEHPMLGPVVEAGRIPNVWGANMAFRREVVELVRRALAAGYRAVYDPRVVVWHRIAAGRMRRRYVSRLYFERAEGDVLAQAAPQGRLLLGVPPFVYRRTAHRLGGWLWAAARRCPDTFDRWLESCEAVGSVWGLWKRHFRARSR